MGDAIKGALFGMLLGAGAGLGVCIWLIAEPIFFPGDTLLIGGGSGAVAGVIWGEDFFDFVKDYWWRL